MLLILKSSRFIGIPHIRLIAIEQWGCGKHPHLCTQRTSRSTSQTTRPLTDICIGNIPDVSRLVDGTLNQRVNKLYGLPSGRTTFSKVFTHGKCLFHEAQSTEITECVKITAGHNRIGLATQTTFLRIIHIGNTVDILDNLPTLAYGLVNRYTTTSIAIQTSRFRRIREFTLEVTVIRILCILGQTSRIVTLNRTAPSHIAMIGVGKHVDRCTVHHISRSVGTIELTVCTP